MRLRIMVAKWLSQLCPDDYFSPAGDEDHWSVWWVPDRGRRGD
jgi:hypothetical protein